MPLSQAQTSCHVEAVSEESDENVYSLVQELNQVFEETDQELGLKQGLA